MKTAIELIIEQREQQIENNEWNHERYEGFEDEEIAQVASAYALPLRFLDMKYKLYPFPAGQDVPMADRVKELAYAGAMILAEIERQLKIIEDETT